MKVLFVCPFVPWPLESGGRIRTYHLIKQASAHAEIHLRIVREPSCPTDAEEALAPWCESLLFFDRGRPDRWRRWTRPKLERWFHSPGLAARLRADLGEEDFHVVHLDELLLARVVPPRRDVPVVQHHHKLDTVLYDTLRAGEGLHRHFDLWKLRRLEAESARRYRHHLLCAPEDAEVLRRRYGALDCAVVPSGFDPAFYRPSTPRPRRARDRILFLGTMNYGPNVDAVRHFVHDVLPLVHARRPEVVLEIVGGEPTPEVLDLRSPRVEVTGRVADVRPYLERTALLVVPLRIGGGTRLKIAEAMAMETPVVSTSIGAEGLRLEDEEHLQLADTSEAFARAVCALLEDPAKAERLGSRGAHQVRERYAWKALGEELVDCWERVMYAGHLSASR